MRATIWREGRCPWRFLLYAGMVRGGNRVCGRILAVGMRAYLAIPWRSPGTIPAKAGISLNRRQRRLFAAGMVFRERKCVSEFLALLSPVLLGDNAVSL